MTKLEAIKILTRLSRVRICDVYDYRDDVREAVNALLPGFEYPEHSYKTCGEFLRERNNH